MAKKQKLLWSNLLWGVVTELAAYGGIIVLTAALAVRGMVPMERCGLLLAVGMLTATLLAGLLWGRRTPVRGWGSLLCSGAMGVILLLGNLSYEKGISAGGIPILLCAALGGVASLVLGGKKQYGAKMRRKVKS